MAKEFEGTINLDVRDSVSDWDAFSRQGAAGRPNVLVVLYDDTGMAAWSPYGGRISMPTMDRLAENGLTYTQWHTTALCSPTRSTFLTGRITISTVSRRFPNRPPASPDTTRTSHRRTSPMANLLRRRRMGDVLGRQEPQRPDRTSGPRARTKKNWPLAQGYDRFYGFIGGRPTTGTRPSPRTTATSSSPTPRGGLPPVEGPGRPGAEDDSRRQADEPEKPCTCGSAPARITPRTTLRRSTSPGTRACSTTATRPTASGSSPA